MSLKANRYKAGAPPVKVNPRRTGAPDSAFTAEEQAEWQTEARKRRLLCRYTCMYCGFEVMGPYSSTPAEFSQQRNDHPSNQDPRINRVLKYACSDTTDCRRRRKKNG